MQKLSECETANLAMKKDGESLLAKLDTRGTEMASLINKAIIALRLLQVASHFRYRICASQTFTPYF